MTFPVSLRLTLGAAALLAALPLAATAQVPAYPTRKESENPKESITPGERPRLTNKTSIIHGILHLETVCASGSLNVSL